MYPMLAASCRASFHLAPSLSVPDGPSGEEPEKPGIPQLSWRRSSPDKC
ncbi:hypothetical protein [Paenibacillus sp. DMB20]|nr:hypothetical protein [Paenibacillus sp. DMB20]